MFSPQREVLSNLQMISIIQRTNAKEWQPYVDQQVDRGSHQMAQYHVMTQTQQAVNWKREHK